MPGNKLKMVKNKQGDTVPFYAADGVGKMKYGGKVKMKDGGKVKGYKHGGCVSKKTNQNPHMS